MPHYPSHAPFCEWYARCTNDAEVLVAHPTIGMIPVCDRCNARQELEGEPATWPALWDAVRRLRGTDTQDR